MTDPDPFPEPLKPTSTSKAERRVEVDPFAEDRKQTPGAPDSDAAPLMRKLLVDAETARRSLNISRTTLDLLVRSGELACRRIRGRVLFSVDALERFARGEDGKE